MNPCEINFCSEAKSGLVFYICRNLDIIQRDFDQLAGFGLHAQLVDDKILVCIHGAGVFSFDLL